MADPRVNYRISAIDDTKKAVDQVKSNFGGLKKVLAGLTVGLSVAGLTRYVGDLITKTDQLGKLTKKIKVDVEDFQRLAILAARENIGQDVLGKALEGQSRKIAEAVAGAGEARTALEAISLDPASLFGLDPIAQFQALASALQQVEDGGTSLFVAQKLWEDQGTALLNLIREQGFELTSLYAATADVVVKTQEQVDATEKLATAWTTLKQRVAGVIDNVLLGAIEPLNQLISTIENYSDEIGGFFADMFNQINMELNRIVTVFNFFSDLIGGMIDDLKALWALASSVPAQIGSFFSPGSSGPAAPSSVLRSDGSGLIQRFNSPVFVGPPRGALE